jgi:hypothetical protein
MIPISNGEDEPRARGPATLCLTPLRVVVEHSRSAAKRCAVSVAGAHRAAPQLAVRVCRRELRQLHRVVGQPGSSLRNRT